VGTVAGQTRRGGGRGARVSLAVRDADQGASPRLAGAGPGRVLLVDDGDPDASRTRRTRLLRRILRRF